MTKKQTYRYLCALLQDAGLPTPRQEWEFHHSRNWRVDYAWPEYSLALEVEGGVWTQGRHTRPSGFVGDIEKYNALACQGWRLIRVQPRELLTARTVTLIREALYG